MRCHGKGRKQRSTPLQRETADVVTSWLCELNGQPKDPVFPSIPHVLRHTAAMELLHHGVDRSVIALWLGHESVKTTQMYLHADMRLKRKALSRIIPLGVKPSFNKPDDELLAFLEDL